MKKLNVTKVLTRTFNRANLRLKKSSPEILIVTGIAGVVVSTVMACKATLKATDILDEAQNDLDAIHECTNNPDYEDKYTEEDTKRDLTKCYVQTGVKLAKAYAPSVILGAVSLTSIVGSHTILRKRNVALAAAYATVDKSFKDYRNRVIEDLGNDADNAYMHGLKAKDILDVITDDDGNETTVQKRVYEFPSDSNPSEYSVIFNRFNPNWEDDVQYASMFLKAQQRYMNDLLRAKGFVTLNTVYEALGFEPTKAGMVVGWIYDEKNPVGDNYVDFGLKDIYRDGEMAILLDFNVDGNIYDKL